MRRAAVATGAVALLLLAGCSQAAQDRTGGAGKNPDQFGEATKVRVYTNADRVPNTAVWCIENLAFAGSLNTDRGQGVMFRLPEWDVSYCGREAR